MRLSALLTLALFASCRSPQPPQAAQTPGLDTRNPASMAPVGLAAAACAGHSIVHRIDLSFQFPPTRDQTKYGVCYSYAATALFEAAFYRRDYKIHSFSPSFAACVAEDLQMRESRMDNTSKVIQGSQHLYLDSGKLYNAAQALLKQGLLAPDDFEKQFQTINQANEQQARDAKRLQEGTQLVRTFGRHLDVAALGLIGLVEWTNTWQSSQKMSETNHNVLKRYIQNNHERLTYIRPSDFTLEKPLTDQKYPEPEENDKDRARKQKLYEADCPSRKNEVVSVFMNHLCSGIPLGIDIIISGTETSFDGGTTWKPAPVGGYHARHSVVLQGIDQSGDKSYFIFRNSWKEGSANLPARSLSRLSMDQLCKVMRATSLTTPIDPPLSSEVRCSLDNNGQRVVCI